jgi:hypothetical protein
MVLLVLPLDLAPAARCALQDESQVDKWVRMHEDAYRTRSSFCSDLRGRGIVCPGKLVGQLV